MVSNLDARRTFLDTMDPKVFPAEMTERREILSLAVLAGALGAGSARAASASRSAGADDQTNYRVEHACAKVIARFFDRLDALNRFNAANRSGAASRSAPRAAEDPWELMTGDGAWRRDTTTLGNKSAFLHAIAALPAGLVTAHLVCNLVVDANGEAGARASFRLLIFSAVPEKAGVPVPPGPPGAILSAHAELAVDQGSWRIRRLDTDTVFHI
jgi:SnoaL-like protein